MFDEIKTENMFSSSSLGQTVDTSLHIGWYMWRKVDLPSCPRGWVI